MKIKFLKFYLGYDIDDEPDVDNVSGKLLIHQGIAEELVSKSLDAPPKDKMARGSKIKTKQSSKITK